ncbi:MAG: hypothetical protein WAW92_00135 [Minisyncoccia bacterium]
MRSTLGLLVLVVALLKEGIQPPKYTGVEPGSRGWITLPTNEMIERSKGYENCGQLFRYSPPKWKSGEAYLLFNFDDEKTGDNSTKLLTWSADKFRVRIIKADDGVQPYVNVLRINVEDTPWAIINISQSKFKRAPCLNNILRHID